MVRSAAAVLAFLILPGFALAQQAQGTHTVVDGDTLWDLAQQFYGNPFDWRRIWEANQSQIDDPNLILPGQVLVIPDTEAPVARPAPETPAPRPAAAPEPQGLSMRDMPTIFGQDSTRIRAGVLRMEDIEHFAVTRDLAYSAPWLIGFTDDPEHLGVLEKAINEASRSAILRSYDRVQIATEAPIRVGDQLQVFRVTRTIEGVGRVVSPTGILTVSGVTDAGVVGVLMTAFDRVLPGDFVGRLPSYGLEEGEYAETVDGGGEAMVMGFAGPEVLHDFGSVAFLDLGTDDGITVGDEFGLFSSVLRDELEGALQVVGVTEHTAAARIVKMNDMVFDQGVVVRLTKKMR
jgi:LysM repeat protein